MSSLLRISEATSLALHTVALLAANPGKKVSAQDLAEAMKASKNHLAKVLQRLTKAGYLSSVRGPRGGFQLSEGAEDIKIIKIYEAIEGELSPNNCLFSPAVCEIGCDCIMGDLLKTIDKQVKSYFNNKTVKDLTKTMPTGLKLKPDGAFPHSQAVGAGTE